jgi:hypothetical protein
MKIVLLKIESESPALFAKKLINCKILLISGLTLLALSYFLEIVEKIYLDHSEYKDKMTKNEKIALVVVNRTLSIVTEFPLIVLQMLYILKFLKKKYQDGGMKEFKSSPLKTKFIVIWIFAILLINSFNTIAFNVT